MKKTLKTGLIMACFAMICTSIIGVTLAQFMTTKTTNDTATMAKWGVEISASGSLFSDTYAITTPANDKAGNEITLSVDSNDAEKVVAPGTENTAGMTFGVTGAPEVAVSVAILITASDIALNDTTNVETALGTTIEGAYNPVVFKLNNGTTDVVTGTLAQVETYLEALSGNYAANTDLGTAIGSYTLTWSYAFDGHAAEDTLLGNIAAGKTYTPALVDVTDYELDTSFSITITVTQLN